jgi:nicotinate phosphoribosyltransferase
MAEDCLTLENDPQDGERLIHPVMRAGRRLTPAVPLVELRAYAAGQLARLPEPLRRLREPPVYPVMIADSLTALARAVDEERRKPS